MTLEKILHMQFSYEISNTQAIKRVLFEINSEWDIDATEKDLQTVITSKPFQDTNGKTCQSFFIHFNAKKSLITKLNDFPEALI